MYGRVQGDLQTNLRKSCSSMLSGSTINEPHHQPEPPNFIDRLTTEDGGMYASLYLIMCQKSLLDRR